MKSTAIIKTTLALVMGIASSTQASAAIISFGSDLVNEGNNVTSSNVAVTNRPGPWVANSSGSVWVSYAQTGEGGVNVPNTPDFNTPSAVFYEDFGADMLINRLFFRVWADDTASVYLNNVLLYSANQVQDGACAAGQIGCETNEFHEFDLTSGFNAGGTNRLTFEVFQRGGGPFGLKYDGLVKYDDASAVPEPGSMALFGGGLATIAFYLRKRKQQ